MSHPLIQNFLTSQKQQWLRKEITEKTSAKKKEKLEKEARSIFTSRTLSVAIKALAQNEFVENTVFTTKPNKQRPKKNISNLNFATHLAKFSHPGIKMAGIVYQTKLDKDGLLRTGNVHEPGFDIFSNSGAGDHTKELIYVYEFLTFYHEGRMLIEHLQAPDALSNPVLQNIFSCLDIKGKEFSNIREKLLLTINFNPNQKTSEAIKQVYFPVKNDYHILSVVYPAAQMSELRKRITKMHFGDQAKRIKQDRKENKYNSGSISELYNLTKIGFGGSNKQNVSILNMKHGGDFFLLPCLPPILAKRHIQPPKQNFFNNCLYAKNYLEDFKKLHKLFSSNDTLIIKNQRRYWIKRIVYQIVEKIWQVRMLEGGWSIYKTYKNLIPYQKIWLDKAHQDERSDIDFNFIREDCVNWLVKAFNETVDAATDKLGDDHKPDIEKIIDEMREALQ